MPGAYKPHVLAALPGCRCHRTSYGFGVYRWQCETEDLIFPPRPSVIEAWRTVWLWLQESARA